MDYIHTLWIKYPYRTLILGIIWAIILTSFCTVHLTGDFDCFIAWARQTHNSNSTGITSLSEIWELKGFLLRSIFLMLYNLSSTFANDITLEFQYVFKFMGVIILNFIILFSVELLPAKYIPNRLNRTDCFFILGILLFAVHFASHLQAEFIAVVLLLLSTCLYLRESIPDKILAGIVIGLTFFLKSPIPIMGGSLMMISLMLKHNSLRNEIIDILPLGISMCSTIGFCIACLYFLSPQEITDMLDASVYQHTLLSNTVPIKTIITNLILFVRGYISNCLYNPVVTLCPICMLIMFADKEYKNLIYFLASLTFPLAYIALSNMYFVYHYYLFAYVSCFAFYYLYHYKSEDFSSFKYILITIAIAIIISLLVNSIALRENIPNRAFLLVTTVSLVLFIFKELRKFGYLVYLCLSIITFYVNSSAFSCSNLRAVNEYNEILKQNPLYGHYICKGKCLYLDAGRSSFFIMNKSYLRYFYPLPIQRTEENNSNFVNSKTFTNTKKKLMSYQNDYIFLDKDWFFVYKHDYVSKLINDNYVKVGEFNFPTWSWDLFCHSQLMEGQTDLYIRNKAK